MTRPTRDEWAMALARETARRSTCLRRAVGCVLLNERGHVLATGYNGVAAGEPHCNEVATDAVGRVGVGPLASQIALFRVPDERTVRVLGEDWVLDHHPHACAGAGSPSGTNLDGCEAIHAEQNALLQCRGVWEVEAAYVTASPCVTCVKMLMNTGCRRIVSGGRYAPEHEGEARRLWLNVAGRAWAYLT